MIRGAFARVIRTARWLFRKRWFQVYIVLLIASQIVQLIVWRDYLPPLSQYSFVTVPAQLESGPVAGSEVRIGLRRWSAESPSAYPPIVLLHGSPSSGGSDYERFAPLLTEQGFDVIAIDFPGFGRSDALVPCYSIIANARYTLSVMDALSIPRAFIGGWSEGGGAAMYAADLEPDRVPAMALLGSIGVQEAEGSGDFHFEHFKYGMGFVFLVGAAEIVPHFGLLGPRSVRYAFLRNFWDTDQRPLEALMGRLETPTLIIQGRRDFLVHPWTAERSHHLIGPSRLLMMDDSHFFPMHVDPNARLAADAMASFFERHATPGVVTRRGVANLAPDFNSKPPTLVGFHLTESTPWWWVILAIIVGTFLSEDLTVIGVGLLIVSGQIDPGVGLMGCFLGIAIGDYGLWALGRFAGRRMLRWPFFRRVLPEASLEKWRRIFERHVAKTVFLSRMLPGTRLPMYLAAGILAKRSRLFLFWVTIAVAVWTPLLLILTALIGPKLLGFFREIFHGPWAILAAFLVLYVLIRLVEYEATALGRQRLKADMRRMISPEFWPSWFFYIPLGPYFALLAMRHRGPMTFTCVNPGIPNGGGVIGESKSQIASGFAASDEGLLHSVLIGAGRTSDERAQQAVEAIRDDPELNGYPVILKPDVAQRGHGVRLAKSDEDVRRYFDSMTRDAIVQRYHAGPMEVGVLWARVPRAGVVPEEFEGRIFSITRKVFPEIEGDGERTLERLVWEHPRFRMQAKLFIKRFDAQSDRVLAKGERLQLAQAGNHCQGTMFLDGADLITPELERRMDAIARLFRDPATGAGIDFGRFDVRYATDEALRRGEGFSLVELNGTMSESTNLYDPNKSLFWTYGVLFRQWRRLFRLGHARRRAGVRPLRIGSLYRMIREHYRGRPGSSIAD